MNTILIFAGLAAILLELFIGVQTGFDLVLLGISLIIGGVAGNIVKVPEVGIAVAVLLSISYIVVGRKMVKNKLHITTKNTNIDMLIGKKGKVVKAISSGKAGQVQIDGEVWRAISDEDVALDSKTEVIGVEGVSIKVKKY